MPSDPPLIEEIGRVFGVEGLMQQSSLCIVVCECVNRKYDTQGPRPDGIGHPLAESDHSESITPHVRVSHPPQPHWGRGVTAQWMVSLGLVQGCFKMYWGLFRVGFGLV